MGESISNRCWRWVAKGGRKAVSKKPMSSSDTPCARPSKAASGVDSSDELNDSRAWYRRVGVCGVIESPENSVGRVSAAGV